MWSKEQGQAIGRIVGEYKDNPANARKRLATEVFETVNGLVELMVNLGKTRVLYLILRDGTVKTDF